MDEQHLRFHLNHIIKNTRRILQNRIKKQTLNELIETLRWETANPNRAIELVHEVATEKEFADIRDLVDRDLRSYDKYHPQLITAKEAVAETHADQVIKATRSLKDMMAEGIPEINWVVENLIPESGLTILASSPGCYKSYLSQYLSLCVAQGFLFLGQFHVIQGTVIYIDEENGEVLLIKRFDQLIKGHEVKEVPDNVQIVVFQGLKLDTDEGKAILTRLIEEYQPILVVLDSMVRLMEGEEDKARDVRVVFDNIKMVMKEHKVAFVILHHLRKDSRKRGGDMGDLRGSSDFPAMSDVILLLSPSGKASIKVTMVKNRYIPLTEVQPFQVSITNPGGFEDSIHFTYVGVMAKPKNKAERCMEMMTEWLEKSDIQDFQAKDAENAMKKHAFSHHNVADAIDMILDDGVIKKVGRGQYTVNRSRFTVIEDFVP